MNAQVGTEKIGSILIVEDSLADYQAIMRVFRKVGLDNPVHHCETGQDALDFLQTDKQKNKRPDIIILDLNLPGTDGREVLKQIKADQSLKSIPVIIFTTSDSERDINACYESGANSYITKPVDLGKFLEVADMIKSYWFQMVALPQKLH